MAAPFYADRLKIALRSIRGECKKHGIDDATRKTIMLSQAGVNSSTKLELGGALKVLDYLLETYGMQARPSRKGNEWSFVDSAAEDRQPVLRRIIVFCRDLGVARGGQVAYVEGIARQMAGLKPGMGNVDKPLAMCSREELRNIAFALDKQQSRMAQG